MVNIPVEYKSLKKVYVDTTNVATQIDSPKVYYKIKPELGYVVCGYCNICLLWLDRLDPTLIPTYYQIINIAGQ